MAPSRAPAVVIGAGPGIGAAVARRFTAHGLPVALLARRTATLRAVAKTLAPDAPSPLCLTADAADETSLRTALAQAVDRLGAPGVVVYNAAIIQADSPGELSAERHLAAWAVNVVGAVTAAAQLLPAMAERGTGSFLVTGGMPEPDPAYTSLSLGKAGVRALVQLLADRYEPAGDHVATVTVGGAVVVGGACDPDEIAGRYWTLHTQPREQWQREIVHG
jgi:NAD(P)-dependent dehydrogenase (short-subunit alcohol dehydrogenase family)